MSATSSSSGPGRWPCSLCAIRSAGMIAERWSGYRAAASSICSRMVIASNSLLLVHLRHHGVEAAEHGDHVRQVARVGDPEQCLKVDERGCPDLHAERFWRPVTDDVEAELALWRLDRRVDLALRH